MVMKGSFREDLFYRLAGAVIRMPAVRERMEDVIPLANYFRKRFAERHGLPDKEWSQEARRGLMERPWPGNVREIENVVTRAFIMAEGACIAARDLGDHDAHFLVDREIGGDERTLEVARDAWTREFLASALRRHRGHRAETARALGVGERTLFRYIEQLGIGDH
jgi:DNA-binding NtrC family response regulator